MKIRYKHIKKIHLYACLSTVATLLMFIFTSYLMIHHSWFSHEPTKETTIVKLDHIPSSDADWRTIADQYEVSGRLVREHTNQMGNLIREYERAGGSVRLVVRPNQKDMEMIRTTKSSTDAIIGIHRQRGYGGLLQYNLYAFLLDMLGVSLILFTITGVIMWFKVLQNNRVAWIIFVAGLVYVGVTVGVLLGW